MDQSDIDPAVMLELMSESVLITTSDLEEPGPHIVYVNAAFEKMTGWTRSEVIGKNPRLLQGPKTDYSIFKNLREKLEKGEVWSGRTINYRKDGSEFYMDWSITPIMDSKGVIHQYIAVQKEVTEIVKTEKKLQKAMALEKKRLLEIQKTNKKLNRLIEKQNKTLSLFTKYVPEPVVKSALSDKPSNIRKGEQLEVALLFCDIRGFTTITDRLAPEQVVFMLNTYYSVMTKIVSKYDGVINEFVGDEIFAAFGAPLPIMDPELSSVYCALDMIESLDKINAILKKELNTEINVGIGINYGPVIAGNLGSKDRLAYSITSSPVITAKRIESLTTDLHNAILISQSIFDKSHPFIKTKPWGKVKIKGKDEKINVYQVLGKKQT